MRIAIVNDMKITVQLLRRILLSQSDLHIAWIAYDGVEAVEKCAKDTPDLILMDLIMPVMGGVEASDQIMKNSPCPILVVTASVNTNASLVFEAMGYGALDAVNTPVMDRSGEIIGSDDLIKKIETIGALYAKGTCIVKKTIPPVEVKVLPKPKDIPNIVVIGASTGGPLALVKLLSRFPMDHNYALVIIQHIDEKFSHGLASWLQTQTGQNVQIAEDGAFPRSGIVHVAGTNHHLVITSARKYQYTKYPEDKAYRPSVDVFFSSVAEFWPKPAAAVLLTGMGDDGAEGMKELYEKGWYTIAQHEDSCVVFGMPKAAIELGVVKKVLDIELIPTAITTAPVFGKKKDKM